MIKEFQKEYRWLSNFAPVNIILDNKVYPSVEHAYMSAKCNDCWWKDYCSSADNTAGEVKKKSRTIKLVSNWEQVKVDIMEECIEQKFNQNPYKRLLIATGAEHIQEGNLWGDKFWGVCLKTNTGRNILGILIMAKREKIMNE